MIGQWPGGGGVAHQLGMSLHSLQLMIKKNVTGLAPPILKRLSVIILFPRICSLDDIFSVTLLCFLLQFMDFFFNLGRFSSN